MKKRFLMILSLLIMAATAAACHAGPTAAQALQQSEKTNTHNPAEAIVDWNISLQLLKDGNERYVSNQGMQRDTNEQDRAALKDEQNPFAVIITCSDSRVSPEIYFDQKLGDIFVIRNAGDIVDATTLGSIEYAVEHLAVPLVVVVGHSKCGAVTAAVNGGDFPENLQSILINIKESIKDETDIDRAIHENINAAMDKIKEDDVIKHEKAKVVGAYYNIETGKVEWNGE